MFQNSSANIKLLNKISEAVEIVIETDSTKQGHPMSPELVKIYLLDLSIYPNDTVGLNQSQLDVVMVS